MKYKVGDRFRVKHYKGEYLTCEITSVYYNRFYQYGVLFENGSKDSYTEEGLDYGEKLEPIPLHGVTFVIQQY